jgi:ribonuclease HI
MSESGVLTIYTDGAARGNPGPAAYAYIIEQHGAPPIEAKGTLGHTTNNVAEYTALVRVLEHAAKLGGRKLLINSDSELLVKQMNGEYQVKNDDLRTLFKQAKILCQRFDAVTIRHVRRAQNSRADRLCNEALDGTSKKTGANPPLTQAKPTGVAKERRNAVGEEAVLCLRAAAGAWARGNPEMPPPEQVWDQLWSILEDNGVLRTTRPR